MQKMPKKELISVLIPVYNAEKYLAEAIESVLNQKGIEPLEIIILDDGSTDASAEVAESYKPKISLYQQENAGISAARNAALAQAKGDFIAFLDADDYWTNEHLQKLYQPFQSNEEFDIVSGYVEQFLSEDVKNPVRSIPEENQVMPGYVVGALLINKTVFKKVGLFNEDLTLADTIDWFARVKDFGLSFTMIEDVVLKRRIHTDNTGIRHRNSRQDYVKALMASIKRKREKQKNNP